jgi:hypothetical protein
VFVAFAVGQEDRFFRRESREASSCRRQTVVFDTMKRRTGTRAESRSDRSLAVAPGSMSTP